MTIMKNRIISAFLISSLALGACTDLSETLYDKVSMDEYGQTPAEVKTIVSGAYSTLRGFDSSNGGVNCYPCSEYVFFMLECASDEACVPTRDTGDWDDAGQYREIQYHHWTANSTLMLSLWNYAFQGIGNVNAIIYQVDSSALTDEAKATVKAELRGLRAYYYYQMLDQFGSVPIVTDYTQKELPKLSTRQEVFNFVEKELKEILPLLPSGAVYATFNQNVGYTLLARLYLNAEVYTGTTRWQECLDACDKVSGYSLETDYFANFAQDNEKSKEIIFAIPYDHKEGTVGNYLASMTFEYNQTWAFSIDGSYPWCGNGISAQPGVYSSFDETDIRRKSLMVGQQYNMATGAPLSCQKDGTPLNYTEEIEPYEKAPQAAGARLNKYAWKTDDIWERDNDWVLMRYAEILLMRAEANFRLGFDGNALLLVNQLRGRAQVAPLAAVTEEGLDKEWLHEFVFEGLRRTVNIRFGTYFQPWWNKDATPTYKGVFPIPQSVLDKNPNLKQNPDYL